MMSTFSALTSPACCAAANTGRTRSRDSPSIDVRVRPPPRPAPDRPLPVWTDPTPRSAPAACCPDTAHPSPRRSCSDLYTLQQAFDSKVSKRQAPEGALNDRWPGRLRGSREIETMDGVGVFALVTALSASMSVGPAVARQLQLSAAG